MTDIILSPSEGRFRRPAAPGRAVAPPAERVASGTRSFEAPRRDPGHCGARLFFVAVAVSFTIGLAAFVGVRLLGTGPTTSIVDIEVGDCFVLPLSGTRNHLDAVEVIGCDQPHDTEVVSKGELNPDSALTYPPDEQLLDIVDVVCGDPRRFHPIGFGVLPVAPDRRTWDEGRGTYVCLALKMGSGLVRGRQVHGGVDELATAPLGRVNASDRRNASDWVKAGAGVISSDRAWAIGSVG